jgi:hypothetical protein
MATTTTIGSAQTLNGPSIASFAGPDVQNNTWLARMTVTLLDTSGQPVGGAVISVTWVKTLKSGSTQTITLSEQTAPDGTFVFELHNLPTNGQSVDKVSFTITNVARTNPPLTYNEPVPEPTSEVTKP